MVKVLLTLRVPVKAKPLHRIQNAIGIFHILLGGIGVIQAHIAARTARQEAVVGG